jgi:hypothetical protein
MVGGLTVSITYTEFIYMAIMLTEVLKQEVQRSLDAQRSPEAQPGRLDTLDAIHA